MIIEIERRASFLSRVLAPPSPTATLTPKTPPDSPAIFHYTLPSPGLVSPLTLFERLGKGSTYGTLSHSCEPWVEEIDFRSLGYHNPRIIGDKSHSFDVARDHKGMPSLDQITARMNCQGRFCTRDSENATNRATRFPTFLTPRIPKRLPVTADQSKMPIRPSELHVCVMALNLSCVISYHTIFRLTLLLFRIVPLWLFQDFGNAGHKTWSQH